MVARQNKCINLNSTYGQIKNSAPKIKHSVKISTLFLKNIFSL
jgi:hypothetical protein